MGATVRRRVGASVVGLVLGLGVLGSAGAPAVAKPPAPPTTTATIAVCCAWDTKIVDGITYSISGTTDATLLDAMNNGVQAWINNTVAPGQGSVVSGARPLQLIPVAPGKGAEVTI